MSGNEKSESGFVNLPSPDKEDPATRGATSQEKDPGEKKEPTVTSSGPSEADGGASDVDAGIESAKVREMEQRMKEMEAILIRMNQEVAGRYSAETRDRRKSSACDC